MPGPQWAPVLGWLWAWSVCGVSAQRWGGGGAGVAPGATEVGRSPGPGAEHRVRGRQGSELSLTSALSAQSRVFPLPHRPSR